MADKQQIMKQRHTALLASAAGLMIGGPLVGLMGISFTAATTLLLVASPLFIIFSPLLLGAACVFALAVIGFAVAGAMAVAGLWSVAWLLRPSTSGRAGWLEKEERYHQHVPYQTY